MSKNQTSVRKERLMGTWRRKEFIVLRTGSLESSNWALECDQLYPYMNTMCPMDILACS